jgi:hypothetical protein
MVKNIFDNPAFVFFHYVVIITDFLLFVNYFALIGRVLCITGFYDQRNVTQ